MHASQEQFSRHEIPLREVRRTSKSPEMRRREGSRFGSMTDPSGCASIRPHGGSMRQFRRICVYCGSTAGDRPQFAETAKQVGDRLARAGIEVVYGGGRNGMMGLMADAAIAAGGRVLGVIPERLQQLEVGHTGPARAVRGRVDARAQDPDGAPVRRVYRAARRMGGPSRSCSRSRRGASSDSTKSPSACSTLTATTTCCWSFSSRRLREASSGLATADLIQSAAEIDALLSAMANAASPPPIPANGRIERRLSRSLALG